MTLEVFLPPELTEGITKQPLQKGKIEPGFFIFINNTEMEKSKLWQLLKSFTFEGFQKQKIGQ